LDLLLYLVRKEEVDIYDIPVAKITNQYLRYIEILKNLDIDLAGDFLVMAATLMHIKSAMLLPKADIEGLQTDDLTDPRAELIRQLLEYKRFKDAANLLGSAAEEQQEHFARPSTIVEQLKPGDEPQIDIEQVSVWDLLEAFDSICRATGANIDISLIKDDTPIDLYQIEVLHRLQVEGPMSFERIFEGRNNRLVMIGLFLALLELVRDKLVWAEQAETSATIYLRALTEEPAEQAVQKAILAAANETNNNQPQLTAAQQQAASAEVATADKQQPAIPIVELPPKSKTDILPDEKEEIGFIEQQDIAQ
jgi:segregation and condensation protein A